MFYERILIQPSSGNENEVHALSEERTRISQPRLSIVLTESILGDGQTFVTGIRHESLKAYEAERETRRADPDFRSFVGKMSGLVSRPREAQLWEVISSAGAGGMSERRAIPH